MNKDFHYDTSIFVDELLAWEALYGFFAVKFIKLMNTFKNCYSRFFMWG